MRIIQVTGLSNTGKTTFIKNLVPLLQRKGRTAVIKHLADHDFQIEPGKDTTIFFEAGAEFSIGIDSNKSVLATRDNSLEGMLMLLKNCGMEFVVIEGFKTCGFKKIVFGDKRTKECILHNPTVDDVLTSIGQFDTFG